MGGTVFDCKKHSNIKRHASYRCIGGGRYYKSIARYKLEKRRRKKILELQKQGYCLTEVASLLGVSRRTMQRDLRKLRPCTQAEVNGLRWENVDFVNLSLKNQGKALEGYREVVRKVRLGAKVKMLIVKVDVEAAFEDAAGAVSFFPRLPVDFAGGGKIAFELYVRGHVVEVARLYAGVPSRGRLSLATNLSKDPTSNPTLGFQVMDSEQPIDPAKIVQLAQIQRRIFCFHNPWCMQEFLNLAPEQQDKLLQQYNELCGKHNPLKEAKTLTITLNVDQALNSAYSVCFKPRLPVVLGDYSKIIIKLQASNKTQHLITLNVSNIEYSIANLERSQPHKKINALKGLRIIDKAESGSK